MNMESGAALRASIATLPFFQYRVNAVSDGWRGASATRCPLARRWSLYSKHSSNVACRSSSVIPSNFPGSMYPKQMYFIDSSPFLWLSEPSVIVLLSDSRSGRPKIDSYSIFFASQRGLSVTDVFEQRREVALEGVLNLSKGRVAMLPTQLLS